MSTSAPIRVLHIGKFYPPDPGGMEAFLAALLASQRAAGLDARALVHGEPREDDPVWLTRVPVRATFAYAPFAPGFRAALRALIERERPQLLHLHLPNLSALLVLSLACARRIPRVVHWHSDVVVSRIRPIIGLAYLFYRPFEQALLRRARCILVSSPDYLQASEPLADWTEKCALLPLGLEFAPRASTAADMPWPEACTRLLSIGRLAYYKGFDTLIRAVSEMPGAHLVIAGAGELYGPLSSLIDQIEQTQGVRRVTLLGHVDEARKHALLEACDIFCLASCERTESFGLAVVEAMAYAKPCVVSALSGSGLPWIVRSSGAGATVPVGDVPRWRSVLGAFISDPAYARACGLRAREAAQARFSIEVCGAALTGLYGDVLGRARQTHGLLVVIPARDEAQTIAEVVTDLRQRGYQDVLVVDDQSADDTAARARQAGAHVLQPVLPLGAWGAMQTGIRYARRHGYSGVVTIDADGQHEPACIADLLRAAESHDVVIGAFPERGSPARQMAWRYFRLITGFAIEDLTSGFRYYGPRACAVLADEEATLLEYQDLGVLLILRQSGMSVTEVPVAMYPRKAGASRIFSNWFQVTRYMLESTLLCLARWHPKHHFPSS